MIYALILAGGKGTRMGNIDMPKQFLELGGKPIIIHTIEQFLINTQIDKIIICCEPDWISYCHDLIDKYIISNNNIYITEGGKNRNGSIFNGCKYIETNFNIDKKDIIITHDAVRPFINQRIINDNIDYTKKYGAVDTIIKASDTIVEAKDGKIISNIPNRSIMYQGQTPQSFNLNKIFEIYKKLSDEEKEIYTDACRAFVEKGEKVYIVNGETYNIKITTVSDLKIANAILGEVKSD